MALFQSDWAVGRKQAAVAEEAGNVVCEKFAFTITEDLAIGDKIELGVLQAYHDVVDATLVVVGAPGAGVTANIGLMDGAWGENDETRTVGDELYAAADVAAEAATRMTAVSGFTLESTDKDRSVGVEIAGAAVTAADQELILILQYRQ